MANTEIKYIDNELVKAVERLQDLGDFKTQRHATEKAGEILNKALDSFEQTMNNEVGELYGYQERERENNGSQFDNTEFGLQ